VLGTVTEAGTVMNELTATETMFDEGIATTTDEDTESGTHED
jgi:hypothetical protein